MDLENCCKPIWSACQKQISSDFLHINFWANQQSPLVANFCPVCFTWPLKGPVSLRADSNRANRAYLFQVNPNSMSAFSLNQPFIRFETQTQWSLERFFVFFRQLLWLMSHHVSNSGDSLTGQNSWPGQLSELGKVSSGAKKARSNSEQPGSVCFFCF